LYRDKDYGAECDLIERIFEAYSQGTIRTILDLGCGTGAHALILGQRGYRITGVDGSEEMLAWAEQKRQTSSGAENVAFKQGDLRTIRLEQTFDAALMMFAVLGYQTENDDVLSALSTARAHLRSGALFVFDVWYGPAVLHQRPSERVKIVPTPEGQILRATSGDLDVRHHVCLVQYRLWRLERQRSVSEAEERHRVRYFFPMELELFLRSSGFSLLRLGAFPAMDRDPDETSWNALGVARAV
jgi:SAM-dependent methyltransferase